MNEDIEEFNAWLNAKDGKFYGMAREYIISIGHAEERERIIKMLENQHNFDQIFLDAVDQVIALIKGK